MAKWCNEGETAVGDVFLKRASQVSSYLGLFKDNTEPAEDATLATITEVTVASGYARIQLLPDEWTEQATKGEFKNLEKTFTASGGNWGDVYGYLITDVSAGTAGKLHAVETFSDGPYAVNDGWSVKVTPTVTVA